MFKQDSGPPSRVHTLPLELPRGEDTLALIDQNKQKDRNPVMKTIQLAEAEKLEGRGYILYRMLNPTTVGSTKFMSFVVEIHPGSGIPEHKHGPAEVGLHFLDGKASVDYRRPRGVSGTWDRCPRAHRFYHWPE